MVVEEVEQIDLGVNVPGQVKVAEKVCSTNRLWSEHAWTSHGGRRSSTDGLWSKRADRDWCKLAWMSRSGGRGSTDIFDVNMTRQIKVTEEVAPY